MREHEGWWASLLAAAAVVVALLLRREVAIGLIVLGACFLLIERALRLRDQPFFRKSIATDCVHFLCGEMLAAPVVILTMLTVGRVGRMLMPEWFHSTVHAQSAPTLFFAACVIGELGSYWGHRLLHSVPLLWRVHKVHHSTETMDWLAPSRHHPLDLALLRLFVAVPLMILGFSAPSIGAPFVLRRIPGLFVHANVRLRYGPLLRWVLTSPEFHHWHHSADARHFNKNFAGSFPIVDKIFGTLHFGDQDSGYWPMSYGIAEPTPRTWAEQMLWPFRRRRVPVDVGPRSLLELSSCPFSGDEMRGASPRGLS